jgi:uncharacterized Tic20 family protein
MDNFDLSKKVKELRARGGLTQEQLADTSGLSLRTIQRIENGETVPRGDTLRRLAVALQVSPDEIIDWQILEDKNVLTMLNLSQLGFLAFPLLGIIIPLAVWILKKDKVKSVDEHGKAILNFQISWVILLFVFYIIFGVNMIFHLGIRFSFLGTSFLGTIIGGLYVYNVIVIIVNTIRIYNGKLIGYKPSFHFLQ